MSPVLWRRDVIVETDDPRDSWQFSSTAYIIKWGVLSGLTLAIMLYLVLGFMHAQRRMKKGLPPLAYHRWLVPRSQRARFEPALQNEFSFYRVRNNGFGMDTLPPPVYDPNHVPPPVYQPPEGATKADPNQDFAPSSEPPPHFDAPPSQAQGTGSTLSPIQTAPSSWARVSRPFRR